MSLNAPINVPKNRFDSLKMYRNTLWLLLIINTNNFVESIKEFSMKTSLA